MVPPVTTPQCVNFGSTVPLTSRCLREHGEIRGGFVSLKPVYSVYFLKWQVYQITIVFVSLALFFHYQSPYL